MKKAPDPVKIMMHECWEELNLIEMHFSNSKTHSLNVVKEIPSTQIHKCVLQGMKVKKRHFMCNKKKFANIRW